MQLISKEERACINREIFEIVIIYLISLSNYMIFAAEQFGLYIYNIIFIYYIIFFIYILYNFLQLHSSAEQLSSTDAWYCPTCDCKQQCVKRLMLWSAPKILVFHLKRFRQNGTGVTLSSSKLSTPVNFPLLGLDVSEFVAQRYNKENLKNGDSKSGTGDWNPLRKSKRKLASSDSYNTDEKPVYDLYSVCYHHGRDLQSGHYTAACLNKSNGMWYRFDDSKVSQISPDEVITADAYLLFYQRQSNCHNSEFGHWSSKIALSTVPASLNISNRHKTELKNSASGNGSPVREYGTLPVRGSSKHTVERDNCSDTELPPSVVKSPVKKISKCRSSIVEDDEKTASSIDDRTRSVNGGSSSSLKRSSWSSNIGSTDTKSRKSWSPRTVMISRDQSVNRDSASTDRSNSGSQVNISMRNSLSSACSNDVSAKEEYLYFAESNESSRSTNGFMYTKIKEENDINSSIPSETEHETHTLSTIDSHERLSNNHIQNKLVISAQTLASIITVNGVAVSDDEKLSAELATSLSAAAASATAQQSHKASKSAQLSSSNGGKSTSSNDKAWDYDNSPETLINVSKSSKGLGLPIKNMEEFNRNSNKFKSKKFSSVQHYSKKCADEDTKSAPTSNGVNHACSEDLGTENEESSQNGKYIYSHMERASFISSTNQVRNSFNGVTNGRVNPSSKTGSYVQVRAPVSKYNPVVCAKSKTITNGNRSSKFVDKERYQIYTNGHISSNTSNICNNDIETNGFHVSDSVALKNNKCNLNNSYLSSHIKSKSDSEAHMRPQYECEERNISSYDCAYKDSRCSKGSNLRTASENKHVVPSRNSYSRVDAADSKLDSYKSSSSVDCKKSRI